MSIIGLTDRTPSFKEIGRLRLGIPKAQALTEGPKEISYFRPDFRPDAQEAGTEFVKIYGDQPTQIHIRLPFPEISRCWDAWYEVYNKAGLLGRADGERWLYLRHNQTSELLVKDGLPSHVDGLPIDSAGLVYMPFNRNTPVYSYKSKKGEDVAVFAKPTGRLQVLVPELKRAAFVTVITHSIYNVMRISEQLAGIQQAAKTAGMNITMVPMILSRREELISVSINGKKSMQEHYMLNIEIDPSWMEAQFAFLDKQLPGMQPVTLALPAGIEPSPEDLTEYDDFSEPEEVSQPAKPTTPVTPPPVDSKPNSFKNPAPVAVAKPAVDEKLHKAVELKTSKGTACGDMTDDQLNVVMLKANGEYKVAAEYLTEKASELAWAEYLAIGEKLTKAGVKINDQLPKNATNIQVWRNIRDLRKALEELNQGVPEEFR